MGRHGRTWLEMAGSGWKWLKVSGNCLKFLEMAGRSYEESHKYVVKGNSVEESANPAGDLTQLCCSLTESCSGVSKLRSQ